MNVVKKLGMVAATMVFCAASAAHAKQHSVMMLNSGPDGAMVFSPAFIKIAAGDEVLFVAKDKAHNAQSIAGLAPARSTPFRGAISQDVKVRFTVPGVYAYECLPHFGMGMVGLVQVGSPVNKASIAAKLPTLPPMARARLAKYLALAK